MSEKGQLRWSRCPLRIVCVCIGIASVSNVASAQSTPPEFDVVSIHEVVNGVRVMAGFKSSGPRAEYSGFPVRWLIAEAWKVRPDQISLAAGVSAPVFQMILDGSHSAHIYDIVGVAPEGIAPTRDEFRPMLRSLLASRFKLATHTEKREMPVYVLVSNGTPRLKANSRDEQCRSDMRRVPEGQKMTATHCPIQSIINALNLDRPIVDESGLTSYYDFEFTSALPFQVNDPQAVTAFTAMQDLGLKLEAQKLPVDTIVIDHLEAPGAN